MRISGKPWPTPLPVSTIESFRCRLGHELANLARSRSAAICGGPSVTARAGRRPYGRHWPVGCGRRGHPQAGACRGSDCCDTGCGFPSFDGFIRGNTTVSDPHSHSGAARRGTFPTPTGSAPKLCRRPGQWFARLGPGRGYPLAEAASSTSDSGRFELSASSSITIIQTAPDLPPWRRP